jgi:hypothetical protein
MMNRIRGKQSFFAFPHPVHHVYPVQFLLCTENQKLHIA